MAISATLRNIRISPRKIRLVADLIRGKAVDEVITILTHLPKGSAAPLLNLLKSAVANAKVKDKAESANLRISKITVDMAPRLKRYMPHAQGRATNILKHASHIIMTLDVLKPKPAKKSAIVESKDKAVEKKAEETSKRPSSPKSSV